MPENNLPFRLMCTYTNGSAYVWRLQKRFEDDELGTMYKTIRTTNKDARARRWLDTHIGLRDLTISGGDIEYLAFVEPEEAPTVVPVLLLILMLAGLGVFIAAISTWSFRLFGTAIALEVLGIIGIWWNNNR